MRGQAVCCWCSQPLIQRKGIWGCPTDECWARQLVHGVEVELPKTRGKKTERQVLYVPLPKQTLFHEAVASGAYRRLLYGGAAGGAKSKALRWLLYIRCLQTPDFRALLLRRTYKDLERTHMREAAVDYQAIPGSAFTPSQKVMKFANGSLLEFGHCQEKGDETNYLSAEYDLIAFDELTTFDEEAALLIMSRARTTKPSLKPMVIAGTNPGGPGASWVRARFIDKVVDAVKYPGYDAREYYYLPATLDDNPYLDEEYERSLDDLPTELRDAYRHGNWDIFPGQYFKEWRRSVHVADLTIPPGVDRLRGLDWGYLRPGVCLWVACLPDGRLYVEDEYVFTETIAQDVAREIAARTNARGVKVRYTSADPAMWIRDGQSGESIAETFARERVPLQAANHERVNGWQRVRHWLRLAPDGLPWLMVSPRCAYLSRTMPGLMTDHAKPEDVNTDGEDHAADALRYLLMSRPAPTQALGRREYPEDSAGALFQAAQRPTRTVLGSENVVVH